MSSRNITINEEVEISDYVDIDIDLMDYVDEERINIKINNLYIYLARYYFDLTKILDKNYKFYTKGEHCPVFFKDNKNLIEIMPIR